MNSEMHWFIDSRYIAIGDQYQSHSQESARTNTGRSIEEFKVLNSAHRLLLGLVGRMLEMHQNRPVMGDNNAKRRFVLTAAFAQGISLCEQAVLASMYLQAGNLLRQEFECLALLRELRNGTRKDGRQVNAKHAPWNGSRHYGELSALAHLSDHEILESIIEYNTSWGDFSSMVPRYKVDNTKRMYGFHVAMVLGLVLELQDLYSEMFEFKFCEDEDEIINTVTGILMENNTLRDKE